MTTYTGVSDENGNFTIPFSQNYTGGQKVTVTAIKDGAEKTIEIYAPSEVTGGGVIQFSGNLTNFPTNIGVITLSNEISGVISDRAFQSHGYAGQGIFGVATGLIILGSVTSVGNYSFYDWANASSLKLPNTLKNIFSGAFQNWKNLLTLTIPDSVEAIYINSFADAQKLTNLTLGSGLKTLSNTSFSYLYACNEIICKAIKPPEITSTTFQSLKSTCIFKVPAESVNAYKAASNWSTYASRIQAI